MSWIVMLTQVVLPLALLAWLALMPAKGWWPWGLQLISVAAILMGIGFAALWTMPPFWTPYGYALLFVAIALYHLKKGDFPNKGLR